MDVFSEKKAFFGHPLYDSIKTPIWKRKKFQCWTVETHASKKTHPVLLSHIFAVSKSPYMFVSKHWYMILTEHPFIVFKNIFFPCFTKPFTCWVHTSIYACLKTMIPSTGVDWDNGTPRVIRDTDLKCRS